MTTDTVETLHWHKIRLTKIRTKYFIPGPTMRGKPRYAWIETCLGKRDCSVRLVYAEIDGVYPECEIFKTLLDGAAKSLFPAAPFSQLFYDHEESLPDRAILNSGGYHWVDAHHVSAAFVAGFMQLTAAIYERGSELYGQLGVEQWTDTDWDDYQLKQGWFAQRQLATIGELPEKFAAEPIRTAPPRKIRGQELTTCKTCGYAYAPLYNRSIHRDYHAKYVRVRMPSKPDPRLTALPLGDISVDSSSPQWLHELVYERACALRHDEGYDFSQWSAEGKMEGKRIHALLLIENAIPIGAASFEWLEQTNGYPIGWHLNFVWVADKFRRQGLLSKRWPQWVATYAPLTLEGPLSEAFGAFLRKVQYAGVHEMNRRQLEAKQSL